MSSVGEEMNLREVGWPQVALALGITMVFFGTLVLLTKLGVDPIATLTSSVLLLLTVLNVVGFRNQGQTDQKIDQIKELSNGRLSEMIQHAKEKDERIAELQAQVTALALQVPPKIIEALSEDNG